MLETHLIGAYSKGQNCSDTARTRDSDDGLLVEFASALNAVLAVATDLIVRQGWTSRNRCGRRANPKALEMMRNGEGGFKDRDLL